MPVPLSTAAKALLATKSVRVERSLEIVRDLLNADLREMVDVTRYVSAWGVLTGDTTLTADDWAIPGMSVELSAEDDRYIVPGAEESFWASWDLPPDECWMKLLLWVTLPSGTVEVLHTYYGKIRNYAVAASENAFTISLETTFAGDEPLDVGVTKSTGDETQVLGSGW